MGSGVAWHRVMPDCYAESLPLVQLWNKRWSFGPSVGKFDIAERAYRRFDGERWIALGQQPTHWRTLAPAPRNNTPKPRAVWLAEVDRTNRALYDRIHGLRERKFSWHTIAKMMGYASPNSICARYHELRKRLSK